MPVLKLTSAFISALVPADKGTVEYWDEITRGLCLRVRGNVPDSMWTMRYRPKGAEGYARISLGRLGDLGLSDARKKAQAIRVEVNDGGDPQKQRRLARVEAKSAMRFDALAQAYLDGYAKLNKQSWRQDEILLKRPRAAWKTRRLEELTRAEIATLLQEIAASAPVSANRTRSVLVKLFNWATDSGHTRANPIAGMKKIAKELPKERVLTDPEIRVFWNALADADTMTDDVADALRLIFLTGQRPGEIAGLQQVELVDMDDVAEARAELPAARMKSGKPHVLPLAPKARAIVLAALERRAKEGEETAVLASRYYDRAFLARHSLSHALRRVIPALMVAEGADPTDAKAVASLKANPPTPHDLRRTVASSLARLGVDGDTRRMLLAHAATDVHAKHYDKHLRLPERRAALAAWETHIQEVLDRGEPEPAELAEPEASGNVVTMAKRRARR